MKPILSSLIVATALTGIASAQTATTVPAGFVTIPLLPNQFNLISLTVNPVPSAAGIIDAESAAPNTITDNQVNFTTLLGASSPPNTPTYILELPDGTIQEITSWSGSVLTTPDDVTSAVVPGTTSYKLRKAPTISDVFGATNEKVGLSPDTDGNFTNTDFILVLNPEGSFETFYYFDDGAGTTGWFDANANDATNNRIVYSESFYVQRAPGSTKTLTITGEVKTKGTSGVLVPGFNWIGSVAPVGLTLGTSGLEAFLTPDTDGNFTNTDTIIGNDDGVFYTAYYFDDGAGTVGWFDTNANDATDYKLEGGFLINAPTGKPFTIDVPSSFDNL